MTVLLCEFCQPCLLLLHFELRYRQMFLRAAAFASLHIVIPCLSHSGEEIILQNGIGFSEHSFPVCVQQRFPMLVQRGLGIPLFTHTDLLYRFLDFEKKTLTVNKSYQRLGREDIITTPKTPKSIRTIPIPDGLCNCLQEYMSHCYGLQKDDRLFPYTKSFLYHEMEYGCKASGVKRIRVHDIRHSHASLLVEMGFSPLLIAERLGHEKVQTTMDTYSHLYPNKQVEVARQLDGIMP